MEKVSEESFESLVSRYSQMVLNTAKKLLVNADAAQDVHQDVFLSIWQRWGKFEPSVKWPGYLYRTTVRKAVDYMRKKRRFPNSLDAIQYTPEVMNPPSDRLVDNELQEILRRCIARLPKKQAQVFVLSRLEGLKPVEIAELMECSHQTVRVHLHRALRSLAPMVQTYINAGDAS